MGLFDWLLGRKPRKGRPSGHGVSSDDGLGSWLHTAVAADPYTSTTSNGDSDSYAHQSDPAVADGPTDVHHHSHHAPATQPSDFSAADHHSHHDPGPASIDSLFDAGGGHHH